jgi:membrane protease YdiL (CAAX protease family)
MQAKISRFTEPLIVYLVLFLPDFSPAGLLSGNGDYQFAVSRELSRILAYNIPSLLLLWYLSYIKGKRIFPVRIRFGDFQSLIIALPGLLGIGLGLSVFSTVVSGPEAAASIVKAPEGLAAWTVMVISCFSTGYLEETYFRHYFLGRFRKRKPGIPPPELEALGSQPASVPPPNAPGTNPVVGILVSTAFFSLCHIYKSPWGVINAAFAGLLLSLVYIHYGALHGLAWAHSLYNIFIYASGAQ